MTLVASTWMCYVSECVHRHCILHACIVYSSDRPSFATEDPTHRYVLLGDSLSLLCGTGLDSNPAATITWTAPDMTTIMDNARYDIENGPEIVRLNFTRTIPSDTGVWVCEATAVSDKYIVSNGQLVRQDNALIGTATVNIQLTVIGEYVCVYRCTSVPMYIYYDHFIPTHSPTWSANSTVCG